MCSLFVQFSESNPTPWVFKVMYIVVQFSESNPTPGFFK